MLLAAAGCSSAPAEEAPNPPAGTATTVAKAPSADPAACRKVAKSADRLIRIVYLEQGEAGGWDWIGSAEAILALDERVDEASEPLRTKIWALVDAAQAMVDTADKADSELADLPVDPLAQALQDVGVDCTAAGHPLEPHAP